MAAREPLRPGGIAVAVVVLLPILIVVDPPTWITLADSYGCLATSLYFRYRHWRKTDEQR